MKHESKSAYNNKCFWSPFDLWLAFQCGLSVVDWTGLWGGGVGRADL